MTESRARLETALAERYRIERELGQGGMATVYLARDLKHDRDVALKVLKPELGAVLGAERFLREIARPRVCGIRTVSRSTIPARPPGCCTTSCRAWTANMGLRRPFWEPIRAHPRFREIMAPTGLVAGS